MIGLNAQVNIYSQYSYTDDRIGGAQITGTLVYSNVLARLEPTPSSLMQTPTGFETARLINIILWPTDLDIRENYTAVVVYPPGHPLFSGTLQIIEVSHDSVPGSRGHIEVLARKIVESR